MTKTKFLRMNYEYRSIARNADIDLKFKYIIAAVTCSRRHRSR